MGNSNAQVAGFYCPVTHGGCERSDCVGALCRLVEVGAGASAPRYRVQVLDDQGAVVGEGVHDFTTLDGVLVLQSQRPFSSDALQHIQKQLADFFPGRRVLILPPDVQFVRLVKEHPND